MKHTVPHQGFFEWYRNRPIIYIPKGPPPPRKLDEDAVWLAFLVRFVLYTIGYVVWAAMFGQDSFDLSLVTGTLLLITYVPILFLLYRIPADVIYERFMLPLLCVVLAIWALYGLVEILWESEQFLDLVTNFFIHLVCLAVGAFFLAMGTFLLSLVGRLR